MSIVVFNSSISIAKGSRTIVYHCEGATKTRISILCEDDPRVIFQNDYTIEPNTEYRVSVKILQDNMTPAIILGKEKTKSDMVYGIYLPYTGYGERVVIGQDNVVFSMSSTSNLTEKTIMIVKDKAVIRCLTYKQRQPSIYLAFEENRWRNLGDKSDIMSKLDDPTCFEVATQMGWLSKTVELP